MPSVTTAVSASRIRVLSVISSQITFGSTFERRRISGELVGQRRLRELAAATGCTLTVTSARRGACHHDTCRHASWSAHAPIGTMRPVSSASADELVGPDQAALGVLPAHERLEADDAPGLEADDRLVVETSSSRSSARCSSFPVRSAVIARSWESASNSSARERPWSLAPVHRGVRVAEQRLRRLELAARQRDADAGGHEHLALRELHRPADGRRDTVARAPAPSSRRGRRYTAR